MREESCMPPIPAATPDPSRPQAAPHRVACILAITVAVGACTPPPAPTSEVRFTDHHVHILGPDVMRDWRAVGVTFSRPDSVYTSAATLLRARPDTAATAVLVPMAHLYGNTEFTAALGIDDAEARVRVRRENAHVSEEARRHHGRAVALCSVPAVAAWALDELRFCLDSLRVAGIKLHLASSMVDLRDTRHLDALARIAALAVAASVPILLHVDPQRRGLETADIRTLADRMFGPQPDLRVVIAHLGGSGGYGPWTRSVFHTLRDWRRETESTEGRRRPIHFELSAVVLERESEGVPATTREERELLAGDLRALEFDRILLGSDYPVFDPVRGLEVLRDSVGLTTDEITRIAAPQAPIFADRTGS
jgi:predicted TIM-barrel fold metal-dependent hydrolase